MKELISLRCNIPGLSKELQDIVTRGCSYQMTSTAPRIMYVKRERDNAVGDYWEVDFTEVKTGKYGYK